MVKIALSTVLLFFVLSHVACSQEIFDAIRGGDLVTVKELVTNYPQSIEARTPRQSTPLLVAVSVDNKPIAEYLIERGAELNAANSNQWTPLFYAQNVEIVKLLMENGASINYGAPDYTPLIHAVWTGNQEVAEYLLANGATIAGAETPYGVLTAIHAIKTGLVPYAERCFGRVIDPLYESEGGSNLLHYAATGNSIELAAKLIDMGVPLNDPNIYGLTPLHKAASNENADMVKLFIRNGADPNRRTLDGRTSYNLAVAEERSETVDYLKSIGADQSLRKIPTVKGEYMGQPRPGNQAIPFAPGIVSGHYSQHGAIVFNPDGDEMYWSAEVLSDQSCSVFTSRIENGKWTPPEVYSRGEDVPFISPDGNRLFCVAIKGSPDSRKEVIKVRDKTVNGWSEPYELPEYINSIPRIHWQVSVDNTGNLYFGANNNIYYSEYRNGTYGDPELVEILKDMNAFSPWIAPDGSYLLASIEREGERLVLLFRESDGSWTEPIDIAEYIGIEMGYCPVVTPDFKYLFFVSSLEGMYAPFWVDAGFIEELRPSE